MTDDNWNQYKEKYSIPRFHNTLSNASNTSEYTVKSLEHDDNTIINIHWEFLHNTLKK